MTFGLQAEHKPQIHEEVFQLIYYGQGFTHSDVYDMPVYLRKFYYKTLIETKQEENKKIKESQKNSNIKNPRINPRFKR